MWECHSTGNKLWNIRTTHIKISVNVCKKNQREHKACTGYLSTEFSPKEVVIVWSSVDDIPRAFSAEFGFCFDEGNGNLRADWSEEDSEVIKGANERIGFLFSFFGCFIFFMYLLFSIPNMTKLENCATVLTILLNSLVFVCFYYVSNFIRMIQKLLR